MFVVNAKRYIYLIELRQVINYEHNQVYTRAEHPRRHQASHQEPQFECPVCQRRFHRKDLLERHYKRSVIPTP
ncbi:uncharacterized protein BKA55DRAFT_580640 [Fusarium redolens]|uniref:C2H2-type domain-containing protein n=1 Tax=Fusarium redolens TaxID=48865 RepID=A0A9P9JQJ5_FUSRE|nr:uncharacterized protein BKA55DRAFT_587805 [Fusarium redolens]XP_046044342.1 uncharacterized protein BKA55DRAFT_580640 [Fusarium redolens]KAH7200787.1 hypothetical protein BKA55DRAFT_587805 [Fusarium redolens]KAH7233997.1 hypothetical protein BKA55DRAFT_580640 [Fusarium redolens]